MAKEENVTPQVSGDNCTDGRVKTEKELKKEAIKREKLEKFKQKQEKIAAQNKKQNDPKTRKSQVCFFNNGI